MAFKSPARPAGPQKPVTEVIGAAGPPGAVLRREMLVEVDGSQTLLPYDRCPACGAMDARWRLVG
ncbi:MAG: hypothetical protein AB1327_11460, partial [Bacillota bacterium]